MQILEDNVELQEILARDLEERRKRGLGTGGGGGSSSSSSRRNGGPSMPSNDLALTVPGFRKEGARGQWLK